MSVPPAQRAPVQTLHQTARQVARLRKRRPRPRVVLANGLFDLLHVGHLRYLRAARRLGDLLIVAINADHSARRLRGPGRPIVKARDRARLLSAIRGVDVVLLFGSLTVGRVLRTLRPDVHCKGTDYTTKSVPERDLVLSYGGTVRIAGDPKRHASSSLLDTISRRFIPSDRTLPHSSRRRSRRRPPRRRSAPSHGP